MSLLWRHRLVSKAEEFVEKVEHYLEAKAESLEKKDEALLSELKSEGESEASELKAEAEKVASSAKVKKAVRDVETGAKVAKFAVDSEKVAQAVFEDLKGV